MVIDTSSATSTIDGILAMEEKGTENTEGQETAQETTQETAQETVETTPEVSTETVETTPAEKSEEKAPEYSYQWRDKAFELAKGYYKDKKELTDKQIEDLAFQGYVSATRRIQQADRKAQESEKRAGEHEKFKTWYEGDFANNIYPIIEDLKSGKARLVRTDEGDVEFEETPKYAKELTTKLSSMESVVRSLREDKEQNLRERQETEQKETVKKQLDEEDTRIADKFPLYYQWIDEAKKSGMTNPNLQQIFDTVEDDKVTLEYAIYKHFLENGLPMKAKEIEKKTIDKMKAKASNNAESSQSIGDKKTAPIAPDYKQTNDVVKFISELDERKN